MRIKLNIITLYTHNVNKYQTSPIKNPVKKDKTNVIKTYVLSSETKILKK